MHFVFLYEPKILVYHYDASFIKITFCLLPCLTTEWLKYNEYVKPTRPNCIHLNTANTSNLISTKPEMQKTSLFELN